MNGLLPALLFTAITGMWQAERRGNELQIRLLEDGELRAVQELRVPIETLTGISHSKIESGRPAPVSFHLRCEAGTFRFDGSFMNATGSGLFIFSNGLRRVAKGKRKDLTPGHLSADTCPTDTLRTR